MDMTVRLVYETEGQHGVDIRGLNGEQARRDAEEHERYLDDLKWKAEFGPPLDDDSLKAMAKAIIG